ncbi:MAG: ABC transporter ATP-binding protein [Gammaproteobacteria bacterium]|nr:ABC transporter ATP-binding protein [Gammaproteobacteria bacterium]MYK47004.1 ABC transporter ATP-binding protein [Gammaproteobacteria bacterium]
MGGRMDRPTDPAAPLALSGVSAGYDAQHKNRVLDEVDLELAPGTITGLLGRNGSGKTTLIRVALGLLRARRGTSRLFAADSWQSPPDVRKRIGYVPQQFAHFGWMKVDACLAMVGSHYGDWDHALIEELMEKWQLENRRIAKLSPGDQQKVAILLAVGHRPDLLLLDEPAASLDPAARRDLLKALVELNADRGQTVLLSSHITSDIERVASHIAILHRGRIVCHEALDEIKDRVGMVTLSEPPWPPADNVLASHRDRHWIWNPDTCGLAADVRVEPVVLEDLFVGVTSP